MDKKNTMLLTVIAVATLLVAVVGATFAYFSVMGDVNSSTTTVTANTASVGSVALSSGSSLYLSLNAVDMSPTASASGNVPYYSTTTQNSRVTGTAPTTDVLSTATLKGGAADVKYECTATYTITVSTNEGEAAKTLTFEAGDAKLVFQPQTNTNEKLVLSIPTDNSNEKDTSQNEIDLSNLTFAAAGGESHEYIATATRKAVFEFTKKGTVDQAVNLYGYLMVTNKQKGADGAGEQNYLAGRNFTVEVSTTNFACDTVAKFASESSD